MKFVSVLDIYVITQHLSIDVISIVPGSTHCSLIKNSSSA